MLRQYVAILLSQCFFYQPMLKTEQPVILAPTEVEVRERYDLGTIVRAYRYGYGPDFATPQKEEIQVFLDYRRESPMRDEFRNKTRFARESVEFDSNSTHRPFFSDGYSCLIDESGHRLYSGRFVKLTFCPEGNVTRQRERSSQPTKFSGLDIYTWEPDVLKLFERLPKHVRDVVGL